MVKKEKKSAKEIQKAKKRKIEKLYEKKPIVEFIVAVLSVPSILLLLLLNIKTLTNNSNAKPTPPPITTNTSTGSITSFFSRPVTREPKPTLLPDATQAPCIEGLGPVSISSPNEGDTVTTNPVNVNISYDDSKYCSAVWSYSVNGSNWSDYNNNSVALYNLSNGPVIFQLRVKSLTNSDSTTLTRNFTYEGQSTAPISASGSGTTH
jgi:hypothetical protein